jgi:hypothetical protein
MSCRNPGAITLAVLTVAAAAACARESPVAPDASRVGPSSQSELAANPPAAAGTYEIFFLKSTRQGLQPVLNFTLNVGEFLVLKSEVKDSNGVRVEAGSVTYEYCEVRNAKVPSSECDGGSGTWKRLMTMPVDPVGSLAGFGSCSTPRTIGFRFRYAAQGGVIASGVSASRDVSWRLP